MYPSAYAQIPQSKSSTLIIQGRNPCLSFRVRHSFPRLVPHQLPSNTVSRMAACGKSQSTPKAAKSCTAWVCFIFCAVFLCWWLVPLWRRANRVYSTRSRAGLSSTEIDWTLAADTRGLWGTCMHISLVAQTVHVNRSSAIGKNSISK